MRKIRVRNIKFKIDSNIIIILVSSLIILVMLVVLPLIYLKNDSSSSSNIFKLNSESVVNNNSKNSFPIGGKVKLYRKQKNSVEELDLEDYVMGVVSSEVPANFEIEALKAQAVAARTYYINKRNNPCELAKENGAEICDTTGCQVYMDKEERMKSWSKSKAEENWAKIERAVKETSGQILTYDGEVLEYPQFFSTSSGKTENAIDVLSIDVPYLKSTESKGEENAPKYEMTSKISINDFINKIKGKYSDITLNSNDLSSQVAVKSRTEAGSVNEIQIGDKILKGTEVRSILGLNSSNFQFTFNKNDITIKCRGYGHGVGMSQWGANAMAKDGATYDQILEHYYSGIKVDKIIFTN